MRVTSLKCDRCGEHFAQGARLSLDGIGVGDDGDYREYFGGAFQDAGPGGNPRMDLCTPCITALIAWQERR